MDDITRMMISAGISFAILVPIVIVFGMGAKTKAQKIIESAVEHDRVVKGHIVKRKYVRGNPDSSTVHGREDSYRCTYEYEVNGRTYKHVRWYTCLVSKIPDELTLYYSAGKPKKVVHSRNDKLGAKLTFLYLMPLPLWGIINWVLYSVFG